jgi:chromosomal replication initiation ATPase DnaA
MGAADFIITPSNQLALYQLQQWPNWPARILILQGAAGAGKSHLARIWAEHSAARFMALADIIATPAHLLPTHPLILEDYDHACGDNAMEQSLFHLCNHYQHHNQPHGYLLLTCATPPMHTIISLPDLRSRLRSYPLLTIAPPDDELLAGLLIKQFSDRQLIVGRDVIEYLVPRIERGAAAVANIVKHLDAAALARHHTITVPLARHVLQELYNPPLDAAW